MTKHDKLMLIWSPIPSLDSFNPLSVQKKAKWTSFKHFIWLGSSWPFEPFYPSTRWARGWSRAFSQNKVRGLWPEIWFADNDVAYGTYRPKKSFWPALWIKIDLIDLNQWNFVVFSFLSKCLSDWLTNPSLTDRGSHHVKLSSPSCLRAFKNFSCFHIFTILFVYSSSSFMRSKDTLQNYQSCIVIKCNTTRCSFLFKNPLIQMMSGNY